SGIALSGVAEYTSHAAIGVTSSRRITASSHSPGQSPSARGVQGRMTSVLAADVRATIMAPAAPSVMSGARPIATTVTAQPTVTAIDAMATADSIRRVGSAVIGSRFVMVSVAVIEA